MSQRDLFASQEGVLEPSAAMSEMRQDLGLQLGLELQQRPCLMLDVDISVQMRMEIQPLLAIQRAVLGLSEADLPEFVARSFAERGAAETFRVIRFVLAGQVKRARPDLTWPKARQIAARLARKVQG